MLKWSSGNDGGPSTRRSGIRVPPSAPKMKEDDLQVFALTAKYKEISLVIDILNKIYNFKGDWNHISFHDDNSESPQASIMIPKGYFQDAEMNRKDSPVV